MLQTISYRVFDTETIGHPLDHISLAELEALMFYGSSGKWGSTLAQLHLREITQYLACFVETTGDVILGQGFAHTMETQI